MRLNDQEILFEWSGRADLNRRPHAPQACALPGCATSRPGRLLYQINVVLQINEQESLLFIKRV